MRLFRHLAAAILLLAAPGLSHAAEPSCGYQHVSVTGTEEAVAVACEALEDVIGYFAGIGLAIEPEVRIIFRDEVFVDLPAPSARRLKVSGCYDSITRTIQITDWNIAPRAERRPWGLAWDKRIVRSVLEHELVHMAAITILGGRSGQLGGAWHEFIAYAIQFELMDEDMRNAVVANHPGLAPFDSPWNISQSTYAADPDSFGLRAWLHMRANGGGDFIRAILEGQAETGMGETSHICPWL